MRLARLLSLLLLMATTLVVRPVRATEPPDVDSAVRTGERATRDVAVIIGNEAYSELPQAAFASFDAHAFRDWIAYSRGVSRSRTVFLDNVDRDEMLKQVKRAGKRAPAHGTVWIYFSGHGTIADDGQSRVLLGVDATASDLASRGVSLQEVSSTILRRRGGPDRVLFVLDAGFGNVGRDGLELVPGHEVTVPAGFPGLDERVVVWAAARDAQPAQPYALARHGLFTWTVLGALRGWADGELGDDPDGYVTLGEAMAFADRAARHLGRVAHPSIDERPEVASWVVAQGDYLEPAPSPDVFSLLAQEDLTRRIAEAESRLKAEAAAFWQDTLKLVEQGGDAGADALQAYIDEFSGATLSVQWALQLPQVSEAQRALSRYRTQGVDAAIESAQVEPCDDLVSLETAATLGKLSMGQQICLENRVKTERLQTMRSRVSRVLLVNAQAAGNTVEWERLMNRHLEEIDRSDPDLCFTFAVYLHKKGTEDGEEAIRWADYALENKQIWVAEEYVRKVCALYRLRAEAAQGLWNEAEQRYREDASTENDQAAREYRGWTMDYSREWLDYARASGKPTDAAMNMCTSASGTMEFCREASR